MHLVPPITKIFSYVSQQERNVQGNNFVTSMKPKIKALTTSTILVLSVEETSIQRIHVITNKVSL